MSEFFFRAIIDSKVFLKIIAKQTKKSFNFLTNKTEAKDGNGCTLMENTKLNQNMH